MEKQPSQNKQELAAIPSTDLLNFSSMDELEKWADKIAKSELTPLKEGKDVVAAVLLGRDLGIPTTVAIQNIYPINGRGTLSVHIMNALLQKAGVVHETIRDYEPCVNFVAKGEDGKALIIDAKTGAILTQNAEGKWPEGSTPSPQILREGFADENPNDWEVKGTRIINFKTIVKATRMIKQPNGTWKEMTAYGSYSYNEAVQAGVFGTETSKPKDAWVKFTKAMCHARATTFCNRKIASEVMMGMYETTEILDTENVPYNVVDGGERVQIIHPEKSKESPKFNTTNVQEVKEEGTSNVGDNINPSQKTS